MVTIKIGKILVVLLFAAVMVGCGSTGPMVTKPDGTTMPQDTYLEEARLNAIGEIWSFGKEAAKPPDSPGNVSAEGEVSHTWFKDDLTEHLSKATQSVGSGKFDVDIVRIQERHRTGRAIINNMPWFLTAAGAVGGGGNSGDTEINFGNRTAKGGGSGPEGTSTVSASGDSTFEDIQITTGSKSPLQTGDGVMTPGKDSQYQTGNGIQGQVFSDPPNLQQPEADTTINSQFGAEAGF